MSAPWCGLFPMKYDSLLASQERIDLAINPDGGTFLDQIWTSSESPLGLLHSLLSFVLIFVLCRTEITQNESVHQKIHTWRQNQNLAVRGSNPCQRRDLGARFGCVWKDLQSTGKPSLWSRSSERCRWNPFHTLIKRFTSKWLRTRFALQAAPPALRELLTLCSPYHQTHSMSPSLWRISVSIALHWQAASQRQQWHRVLTFLLAWSLTGKE